MEGFDLFFNELINEFQSRNTYYSPTEFEGCSQDEIKKLNELVFPNKLPGAYIAFLNRMGKKYSVVSGNVETYYSMAFDRQEFTYEALKEDGCEDFLRENRFTVGSHDGFINFIISLNAGDNPPVYEHVEGRKPEKHSDTFTEFLLRESGLWHKREKLMKTLPVLD